MLRRGKILGLRGADLNLRCRCERPDESCPPVAKLSNPVQYSVRERHNVRQYSPCPNCNGSNRGLFRGLLNLVSWMELLSSRQLPSKILFSPRAPKSLAPCSSRGPVVIDGHVEGEITGQDKITVGENGFVTANKISAASIVIAGAVKVNTIASRRIEILPTGKVWSDLASPVLSIHEGARFEGQAFAREAQGTPEDSKAPPGESGG